MCYDKYGDVFHEEGANWFDNVNCVKYTCRQDYDDNHMVVVTNGCLQLDAKPPCKIRYGNERAKYPGCCKKVWCPDTRRHTYRRYLLNQNNNNHRY
ncbi:unnamed protein product [Timema podura]|uniref:Single domain-containing protein n=1 Tax=Timema podura TaxID=61482 RepID=A0ABN7PI96_TIMPD|nr:unnamed protein product [Timema podura]